MFYFYNRNRSIEIKRFATTVENVNFEVVNIDYSKYVSGNFITLE